MAFVPASSLPPSSVAIVGTVDVSDRAARLLGHVTVDNASLVVTGPMTDTEFAAHLPLTVNQGTSPWLVDGSAVTQPVSADALPLPDGAATEDTLSDVGLTAILQRERLEVE